MGKDIVIPAEIEIKSTILLESEDLEEIESRGVIVMSSIADQTINGVQLKVTSEIKLKGVE